MTTTDAGCAVVSPPTTSKEQPDYAGSTGAPPHYVVFDIELEKKTTWKEVMEGAAGISVAVVWDSQTGRYHLYDKHTLTDLVGHLNSAGVVVGYNSVEFDVPVIEAVTGLRVDTKQDDILQRIWRKDNRQGYKLGDVAARTLGLDKSGNGVDTYSLVQGERWAELFDYCLSDVYLTKRLYEHILEHGYVIDIDGEALHV